MVINRVIFTLNLAAQVFFEVLSALYGVLLTPPSMKAAFIAGFRELTVGMETWLWHYGLSRG
ncbi:hypothetical protein ACFFW8_25625 [Erwinia tracheiphila]